MSTYISLINIKHSNKTTQECKIIEKYVQEVNC